MGRIFELMQLDLKPGTEDGDEFEILTLLVKNRMEIARVHNAMKRSAKIIVFFRLQRSTKTPVNKPRMSCGRREAMVA